MSSYRERLLVLDSGTLRIGGVVRHFPGVVRGQDYTMRSGKNGRMKEAGVGKGGGGGGVKWVLSVRHLFSV